MGLNSYILAVGKFNNNVKDCLEYPDEFYDNTKDGTTVTATLFYCDTSSQSNMLAECLDIGVWDFNTHVIKDSAFCVNNLKQFIDNEYNGEDYCRSLERFKILVENDFKFIFLPNG